MNLKLEHSTVLRNDFNKEIFRINIKNLFDIYFCYII